jgi:hypothetical protein
MAGREHLVRLYQGSIMSLAPHERRALASIEESLGSSDPRLAAMLATFTLPSLRNGFPGGKRLIRRIARAKRFLLVALAFVAVCAVVMFGLLHGGNGGATFCDQHGGSPAAGRQVLNCPPALPSARPGYPADRWNPGPAGRDIQLSQEHSGPG